MNDDATPRTDAHGELASDPSVAAIAKNALSELSSTNEAATSLLVALAEADALFKRITDGTLRDLADELIGTCHEADDAD